MSARLVIAAAAIAASLGIASPVRAGDKEAEGYRFVAAQGENDLYVGSGDRHYTNGLRLAYGFRAGKRHRALAWFGSILPLSRGGGIGTEYEIGVGQQLYTPEDFFLPEPLPFDRPFAAWLYAELNATARKPGVEESFAVSLGVIGPAALGDETQSALHRIGGAADPLGWVNQLSNEPAILVRYRRSWFVGLRDGALQIDLVPRLGAAVGTVVNEAEAGALLRFGSHLTNRDIPLRLQPGASGNSSRFDFRKGQIDWQIFFGGQARGVAHSLLLDGNIFSDSLSVDRLPFVWDASIGIAVIFGQVRYPLAVSFTRVWRGREFSEQVGINRFGSIQIGVAF